MLPVLSVPKDLAVSSLFDQKKSAKVRPPIGEGKTAVVGRLSQESRKRFSPCEGAFSVLPL